MPLADAHVSFHSRTFFEALALLSPLPGEPADRLARLSEEIGMELPAADAGAHLDRWLAELDRAGVAHAVFHAEVDEERPVLAEAAARAKGRISCCAYVNPLQPECETEVWSLFTDLGYRALLLLPGLDGYRVSGEEAVGALRVADDREALVFVHCGLASLRVHDLLDLPAVYDLPKADPADVAVAAQRFPRAHFVIQAFGGGYFREALMAGAMCDNVYLATSYFGLDWIRTQPERPGLHGVLQSALDVFGARRLLFGSGSHAFPEGWRRNWFERQRSIFGELRLSESKQNMIFGDNLLRLLGTPLPA